MRKRKLAKKTIQGLTMLAAILLLSLSIAAFFGTRSHFLELLSNLRVPLFAATGLLTLVGLCLRAAWTFALPVAGMVINAAVIAPLYFAEPQHGGDTKLSVATINIYGSKNKNYKRVFDYVRERHPDVLCLNEITLEWLRKVEAEFPEYKYHFHEKVSGGAAIYSRLPIEATLPPEGPWMRRYGVRGVLRMAGRDVLLIAAHPPAPLRWTRAQQRNGEFERLAAETSRAEQSIILIGDLNATPWSPYFTRLVESSGLHDSELGYGVQPTWSEWMPMPMVPIDHCLTSKDLVVTRREVGPDVGSDHLPLLVDVRVAQ